MAAPQKLPFYTDEGYRIYNRAPESLAISYFPHIQNSEKTIFESEKVFEIVKNRMQDNRRYKKAPSYFRGLFKAVRQNSGCPHTISDFMHSAWKPP